MSDLPSFPFHRPDLDADVYVSMVGDWLSDTAVRRRTLRVAVASGHASEAAEMAGVAGESAGRKGRCLRQYLAAKLGHPLPGQRQDGVLDVRDLDDNLVAAANSLSVVEAQAIIDGWRSVSRAALRKRLTELQQRGSAIRAAFPELVLHRAEPGPPRGLALPDETAPVEDEVERVAPGTAPGSREQLDALVAAALRGDLNMALLPHHIAAAVLAALEERARALGKAAGLPAAVDPEADPEALLRDMLASPEFALVAAALQAAVQAARNALGSNVLGSPVMVSLS